MRTLVGIAVAALAAVNALSQELWRIGEFDNTYDEFACARDYPCYPETLPQDVTYRVGESGPEDWSFVHPGPADHWAGAREHPFVIEFDLPEAPTAPLRLTVDLVDVQGMMGSSMRIAVNDVEGTFRLQIGHEAAIHDPAQGQEQVVSPLLPASLFRQGANKIALFSTGSWFLYDAVSLSSVPEAADMEFRIKSLQIEPTVLLKRLADGRLGQVVIARIEMDGPPEDVQLAVQVGAEKMELQARPGLTFGTIEQELLVPEVSQETAVTVRATAGESSAEAEATLKPERHWRIFMAPSAHTDIGYTDLQPRVIDRHNDNTDRAIDLCERFPAFGWNLEVAWQADIYRERRSRERCERLYELARRGQVGVQASYLNMLTGLCSHEELNRWLYYAQTLQRRHGVPFESALTTDVPTQVWSVPTTLAAAGIRYYATGINNTRGYTFRQLQTGHPYWWEGPDGSRVLAYFSAGYAQSGGALQSLEHLRNFVIGAIHNRDDFPYDALFFYGAFGDNQPLNESIAETAQKWADEYEYPKAIVGPQARYFEYMQETYGDQIPAIRGDAGVYWEDGAGSSAQETTLNRRAHESASAADSLFALSAVAGGARVPEADLRELWRNILLYDEHTWGAWCSISQPDSEQTVGQWEIKAQFAHDADRQGKTLLDEGLTRLASLVATDGPALLIYNATSWTREGNVVPFATWQRERGPEDAGSLSPTGHVPLDPHTGEPLPVVDLDPDYTGATHDILMQTPSIPPWGYVVCPLAEGDLVSRTEAREVSAPVLENEHLRLKFDPQTGGIASLIDRQTGRDLADPAAPHTLNEYLYVSGGDGTNIVDIGANKPAALTVHTPTDVRFTRVELPGLGSMVVMEAQCEKTRELQSIIMLPDGVPAVWITNNVMREPERKKEAAYFAFPFAAERPEIRMEIPNGVMRPEIDQLPGACRDWYAMQHWVRIGDGESGVALASPDAPLLCVGDINRGLWQEELNVETGHLYSYIMNNYWFTNYKADQGGQLQFRYALTTRALSDAEAARFGWQASMPLQLRVIPGAQDGPLPSRPASLCRVEPDTVMITAIKAPEVGSGQVVRLFSLDGKPVTARVSFGPLRFRSATLCNLVEEPIEDLALDGSTLRVRIKPMTPTTVLVK